LFVFFGDFFRRPHTFSARLQKSPALAGLSAFGRRHRKDGQDAEANAENEQAATCAVEAATRPRRWCIVEKSLKEIWRKVRNRAHAISDAITALKDRCRGDDAAISGQSQTLAEASMSLAGDVRGLRRKRLKPTPRRTPPR